jgi:hypothetical protein
MAVFTKSNDAGIPCNKEWFLDRNNPHLGNGSRVIESGNSRIRRSHAAMASFSHLLAITRSLRGSFLRKNDVAHPHVQRCLFVRLAAA